MIKVRKLKSGLKVVMEKIDQVQSVSIGIWARAGAVNEDEYNSGISHFIEHMMFKGTKNRSAKKIASDADRIAGQYNAFTGKEATCYYMKTLTENVEKGIDILTDMVMNSLFDKEEMDKERKVILEEMKMIEDSPEDDIHDIIMELVFKGKPLANSIIGTEKSLENIDTMAIKKYIQSEYTSDRLVVAIAGNFDEEKVISLLEGKFDGLNSGNENAGNKKSVIYKPEYRLKIKDIEQAHLCAAIPTISRSHADYQKMQVLNSIFGGSMSSRLFQNIREAKGLAYSVYSMTGAYIEDGFFNIYAGVSHEKIESALLAVKEELLKLKNKGITPDEIEIAKAQLMGSYIYSMENTNSRMFFIGKNMVLNNEIITMEEMIESIKSVTLEQVNDISSLITRPDMYSIGVITDHELTLENIMQA